MLLFKLWLSFHCCSRPHPKFAITLHHQWLMAGRGLRYREFWASAADKIFGQLIPCLWHIILVSNSSAAGATAALSELNRTRPPPVSYWLTKSMSLRAV